MSASITWTPSLLTLDLPNQARTRALRKRLDALGAEAAWTFLLVRGADGMVRMHGCHGVTADGTAADRWRVGNGLPMVMTEADPEDLPPVDTLVELPEGALNQKLWRWAVPDLGYRAGLFANFVEGTHHRGVVCFVRRTPGPWTPPRPLVSALVPELGRAMRAAWAQEEELAPPRGALDFDGASLSGSAELLGWARR